jgi:hypothetical protein
MTATATRAQSEIVLIVTPLWATDIVFHDVGDYHEREDGGPNAQGVTVRRWVSRARCGVLTYEYRWKTTGDVAHGGYTHKTSTTIRRRYAERFARPCARCYPEATRCR